VAIKPIEIACEEVWGQISNYLDSEVHPTLRAAMASHFKDCARCSAVLDGIRNVILLVGDERAFEIPVGTSTTLYRKLNDYLAARQPD
jgi:anti-sigma factor RsiW